MRFSILISINVLQIESIRDFNCVRSDSQLLVFMKRALENDLSEIEYRGKLILRKRMRGGTSKFDVAFLSRI